MFFCASLTVDVQLWTISFVVVLSSLVSFFCSRESSVVHNPIKYDIYLMLFRIQVWACLLQTMYQRMDEDIRIMSSWPAAIKEFPIAKYSSHRQKPAESSVDQVWFCCSWLWRGCPARRFEQPPKFVCKKSRISNPMSSTMWSFRSEEYDWKAWLRPWTSWAFVYAAEGN